MFAVHCPHHGGHVLLDDSSILGIVNSTTGILVHWQCTCGELGSTETGRRARSPAGPLPAQVAPA
jgi:hypothetical protein